MEVKHRLLNYLNVVIYQNDEWFSFSLDTVLLANFVSIKLSTKRVLDLATGNAPIPLILSFRTKGEIYGVELQDEVYSLAIKSIKENNLDSRIKIINADARNVNSIFESDTFDVITCNPPYFKVNEKAFLNNNEKKIIARHEVMLELDDIFRVSKKILKNNGVLAIVHRPDRLLEILIKMKEYNIEPKKIQFVYPKKEKDANLVLIEGMKNGHVGLKILKPLFVHQNNGEYTNEIKKMFNGE